MNIEAQKYKLPTCKAGTTYRFRFRLMDKITKEPYNLTGYSARMQLRTEQAAETAVLTLVDDDGIIIEADQGAVNILIDDTTTSSLIEVSELSTTYVYDIELVSPTGEVICPLYGSIKVIGEVTREIES